MLGPRTVVLKILALIGGLCCGDTLGFIQNACAQSSPIYPGGLPTGMGIVHSNPDANGNYVRYGGSSGAQDNWSFSQNTNPQVASGATPQDFSPLSQNADGSWSAGNGLALIQWFPPQNGGQPGWQMAQNGQYLPCSGANSTGPLEYGLYINPNGAADPYNPAQYPMSGLALSQEPMLSELASYSMSGTYQTISARYANQNNGCQLNSSNSSFSVLMVNTQTNPHQLFYYSALLTQICYDDGAPGSLYSVCQQNNPSWFWLGAQGSNGTYQVYPDGTQVYGLSDTLQAYGYSQITDNNPHQLNLDIRTRVITIISGGYMGMDPNIADWQISGPSIEQVTWGNTYLQTLWNGFVPVLTKW